MWLAVAYQVSGFTGDGRHYQNVADDSANDNDEQDSTK